MTTTDTLFENEKFRNVQKMPALFVIDRVKHIGTDVVNEKAAWVFTEEARTTIKHDGTGVTVTEDGKAFARRSVRKGKTAPAGFRLAETDPVTGHAFGIEPIEQSGFIKMFKEALAARGGVIEPGTYELVGPKISGNPEKRDGHVLISHGEEAAVDFPDMRDIAPDEAFAVLKEIFTDFRARGIEGIVWWGAEGKRAKLRTNDFFGDPNRR